MTADAEQALLQLPVRSQLARVDQPVDATVDHDGDGVGHDGCNADVLLDDEDVHIALVTQLLEHRPRPGQR